MLKERVAEVAQAALTQATIDYRVLGPHDSPHPPILFVQLSYTRQVPRSLMRDLVLTGASQQIIEHVASWRSHGLRVQCGAS